MEYCKACEQAEEEEGKQWCDKHLNEVREALRARKEYDERQKMLEEWHHGRRGNRLAAADAERKRRGEQ